MALFLDEHVDVRLATMLAMAGYDVLTTQAAGRALQGLSDEDQLEFASTQGRAIFTHNVADFVELASRWTAEDRTHAGIILSIWRPAPELNRRLRQFFEMHPNGIDGRVEWL